MPGSEAEREFDDDIPSLDGIRPGPYSRESLEDCGESGLLNVEKGN